MFKNFMDGFNPLESGINAVTLPGGGVPGNTYDPDSFFLRAGQIKEGMLISALNNSTYYRKKFIKTLGYDPDTTDIQCVVSPSSTSKIDGYTPDGVLKLILNTKLPNGDLRVDEINVVFDLKARSNIVSKNFSEPVKSIEKYNKIIKNDQTVVVLETAHCDFIQKAQLEEYVEIYNKDPIKGVKAITFRYKVYPIFQKIPF
jgi:hypothetical protein